MLGDTGSIQVTSAQAELQQVKLTQLGSCLLKSGMSGQDGSPWEKKGNVGSGHVRSSQVNSSQVGSCQIKLGQVRSSGYVGSQQNMSR